MDSPYDAVAGRYDQTRGGEPRGGRYAGWLSDRLLPSAGPVLELGVGTGLVSLGLRRRGYPVIGVDLSAGMLARARRRLGGVVVRADVCRLPFPDDSFDNVVSVWMVHAVADPPAMFREVCRVLRPGGRALACPTNRPALRDPVGVVLGQMFVRLERLASDRAGSGRRAEEPAQVVDAGEVLAVAREAGLTGHVEQLPDERWRSTLEEEIAHLTDRTWAPLGELDADSFEAVVGPALAALRQMRPGPIQRRAVAQVVVLERPDGRGDDTGPADRALP